MHKRKEADLAVVTVAHGDVGGDSQWCCCGSRWWLLLVSIFFLPYCFRFSRLLLSIFVFFSFGFLVVAVLVDHDNASGSSR